MKLFYSTTALSFLLLLCPNLSAQWESIGAGSKSDDKEFFSISVVDEENIWALPINSDFTPSYEYSKTDDGGKTWELGTLPDTMGDYFPANIYALDEYTAWIIMINIPRQDHIKLFKTEDGGAHWTEQYGKFNKEGNAFATLHFFNENEGVGFGSPGTNIPSIDKVQIFITHDGGDSWMPLSKNKFPTLLNGEGVWVYSGNNSYEVKGDTLWFVTRASRVFRSVDKGNTWEAFRVPISGNGTLSGLSSIAFEDSKRGIAVTFKPNKAARTEDGGETWEEIEIPGYPSIGAIEYVEGTENTYITNDGYLDTEFMLLSEDGGKNWDMIPSLPSVMCMQFISPSVGIGGGKIDPSESAGLYKWSGDFSNNGSTAVEDDHISASSIALFPNPAMDDLYLRINNSAFITEDLTITIYTMDGKVVKQESIRNTDSANISVTDLNKGLYTLHITTKNGRRITQLFFKG